MHRTLFLASALFLAACGKDVPPADAGYSALQAQEWSTALSSFDTALGSAKAGTAEHRELTVARLQALAHVDAKQAEQSIVELTKAGQDGLATKDISLLAGELMSAGATLGAIQVMDAAAKAYPDDEKIKALKLKVVAMVEKMGDDSPEMAALKGMGYLGGE